MMHGCGKSSPVIVAGKPANKAQPETVTATELVAGDREAVHIAAAGKRIPRMR
jgi:hypothetical protein